MYVCIVPARWPGAQLTVRCGPRSVTEARYIYGESEGKEFIERLRDALIQLALLGSHHYFQRTCMPYVRDDNRKANE